MQAAEVSRAVAAAKRVAGTLGLAAKDAVVLHNSNKLSVRLLPCDTFARIAPQGRHVAGFEIELARRLAETASPVAALEPRVAPAVYEQDGFAITLWTYYPSVTPGGVAPADYADALERLHAGLRRLAMVTPHYTDRVLEAQQLVADWRQTPTLTDPDRELLSEALGALQKAIADRRPAEQLLHGEPHPGNLLAAEPGALFIDLETCCRGPVEFDLAHVTEAVARCYPGLDPALLDACRGLVLAMVAAWRWDADDQFPNGRRVGEALIGTLRKGPPWPTLDVVMERLAEG